MSTAKLVFWEIRHRASNFVFSLLAVTTAATLFVAGPTLVEGYGRQTREFLMQKQAELERDNKAFWKKTSRIMRDAGFNLLILHKDTNMVDFWGPDYKTVDMPQEYVSRLANSEKLTLVTHIVATLGQRIEWRDRKILLVGYAREVPQPHLRAKTPMGPAIDPGSVHVGHDLSSGLAVGDEVEILGLVDSVKTTCTGVEMFKKQLDRGEAGDNVGALLRGVKREDVQRGQILAAPGTVPTKTKFEAEVYVLTKEEGGRHTPFFANYRPQFFIRTADVTGTVSLPEGTEMVMPGDNATLHIELIAPVALTEGLRFALREGGKTVGAGVVSKIPG